MKLIVVWVLTAMLAWIPAPEKSVLGESSQEHLARREEIARQFVEVAFDPAERPLFEGPSGRAETALFLASIASFESRYDVDVDNGKRVGGLGEVCIMQVMVDWSDKKNPKTKEGWTTKDLISDRKKCIRAALHMLQTSQEICSNASHPLNATKKALKGADQFTIYTGGKCSEGSIHAAHRFDRSRKWSQAHPAPSVSASTSTSAK